MEEEEWVVYMSIVLFLHCSSKNDLWELYVRSILEGEEE